MLLKRLELRGFKSFADPTLFEFDQGITAIVGPNGSGKSNIADAIRWVLGEQSIRALRGKRTEDVIFAGSSVRNSVGMAEVSLTFDNSDQRFDLPYSEVVVTRRAYRSGENEYLINRERTRWRDLVEILQKASVVSNGYAVIGQGLIDMALSLKADERRELLEEAADVKRYRTRLAEAKEKLLTTQQNILRANDVISEISPRLRQLEAQAQQLHLHQQVSEELRAWQRQWFIYQWNSFRTRLTEATEFEIQAKSQLDSLRADLERQAQTLVSLASERLSLEAIAKTHREERSRADTRRQEIQRALAVQQERLTAASRQLQELRGELATIERERGAENQQVDSLRQRLAELTAIKDDSSRQIAELEQTLADQRKKRQALSAESESISERAFVIAARGTELRNQIKSLRDRYQEVKQDTIKNQRLLDQGNKKLADLNDSLREAQQKAQALDQLMADLTQQRESLRTQAEAQRTKQQELREKHGEAKAQLGQLRARFDLLSRLQSSRTGYYSGVKAVLDAANADGKGQRLSGIIGIVAGLLKASADLETAIDTALGSRAQDIVVARWDDAEAAIQFLKRQSAGRATFLPLDTLRVTTRMPANDASGRGPISSHRPGPQWPPADESGVHGVAAQLVQYDPSLAPVAWYLLGRVLVVNNMPTARQILKRCPPGWLIVTLAGEIIRPGGAITGGSRDKQGTVGLLTRERELRELPDSIRRADEALAALARALEEQRQREAALANEGARTEQQIASTKRQLDEANRNHNNMQREVGRLERETAWCQAAQERLNAEVQALSAREEDLVKQIASIEDQRQRQTEEVNRARQRLADAEVAEREALAAVNDATRAAALRQGEIRSVRELLEARLNGLASLDKQLEMKRRRMADLQTLLSDSQGQKVEMEAELARHRETLRGLDLALADISNSLANLHSQEEQAHQAQDQLRRQVNEAEMALRKAALETARWREETDRLRQQLRNEDPDGDWIALDGELGQLSLPLPSDSDTNDSPPTRQMASPEQIKQHIDELKSRLRGLGVINHQAATEYEEVRSRHSFLVEQVLDLERASESLQKIIGELERAARKRFEDTFEAVAREFSKHFVTLFGGGSAKLLLARNGDAEPGVEIVVQPPGKRAQNLSLLSGGERALTAAALIFAVLEIVPTPFSVLDEVDAALDDANVDRFCRTLSNLSRRTQFIVITHNRGTMDTAETIYGVSMSESHTSRVLSLRMPSAFNANLG